MLSITIPDKYFSHSLESIGIYDESIEEWSVGHLDPCLHILGITVLNQE